MPRAVYTNNVNFAKGNNSNIIEVLHANINRAVNETKNIAAQFKGNTPEQTGRNIFDFLKTNIKYVRDLQSQDIKTPSRFLTDGTGDCKSFALFTCAILKNLGYNVFLRYASYDSNPTPQHVYCGFIAANGNTILIDAVYHSFNQEQKYTYKKDYYMQIRSLNGLGATNTNAKLKSGMIGCTDCDQIGVLKKARANVKQAVKKVETKAKATVKKVETKAKNTVKKAATVAKKGLKVAKTAALTAPRNSFLLMVQTNFLGFASNLYKQNRNRIHEIWAKLGGQKFAIDNAIEKGSKRKPILNKNAEIRINGIGGASGVALLAAAAPVIAAFGALLAAVKKDNPNQPTSADALTNTDESGEKTESATAGEDFVTNAANLVNSVKSAFGGKGTNTDYSGTTNKASSEDVTPQDTASETKPNNTLLYLGLAAGAFLLLRK